MGGQCEERQAPKPRSLDTNTQPCDEEMTICTNHLHTSGTQITYPYNLVALLPHGTRAYMTRRAASNDLLYTLTTSSLGI